MKFQDLVKRKIEERLEKIYRHRKKWNRARGPFDKSSIRKRELILFEQRIIENLIKR